MGQIAMTIGGFAVGSLFGMPQLGAMAGGILGGILFAPKGAAPQLRDLQISGSQYGSPISILYGTARLPGNMIFCSGITEAKSSGKGGLGGSGSTVKYQTDLAIAFCEGPVDALITLYADGKVLYDSTNTVPVTKNPPIWRFYPGDDSQNPDYKIAQWISASVSGTPYAWTAFRGICYIVFESLDLADYGGRIPNFTAVLTRSATVISPAQTLATIDTEALTGVLSGASVNWNTQRLYVASSGSADGGIRVFDLYDNSEIKQVKRADIFDGYWAISMNPDPSGIASMSPVDATGATLGMLAIGSDDQIWNIIPAGNSAPIYTINANTFRVYRKLGQFGSGLANTTGNIVYPTGITLATCYDTAGNRLDYVFLTTLYGDFVVIAANFLRVVWQYTDAGNILDFTNLAYHTPYNQVLFAVGVPDYQKGTPVYLVNASGGNPEVIVTEFVCTTILLTTQPACSFSIAGATGETGATGVHFSCLVIDPTDGNLVATFYVYPSGNIYAAKFDLTSGYALWVTLLPSNIGLIDANRSNDRVTANLWAINQFQSIDISTGTVLYTGSSTPSVNATGDNYIFDAPTNSVITSDDGQINRVYLNRAQGSSMPISYIITDVCEKVGMDASQLDTSQLTQSCLGYVIDKNTSAKAVLEQLAQAYLFDVVESDFVLKFVPRGQAPIATITQDYLASPDKKSADGGDGMFWKPTRAQEMDLPLQINIRFSDNTLDFQSGTAYAKRIQNPTKTMYSNHKKTLDMPIVMDDQTARNIAESLLYMAWAERDRYETTLPQMYLWLDPSDNITVNLNNGDSYTVRLAKVDIGADFSMKLSMTSEDITTYSPSGMQGATPTFFSQAPQTVAFSAPLIFDTPLLQDLDDTGGGSSRVYYAAGPYNAVFNGAVLYESTDGSTYNQFDNLANAANWGTTLTALGGTTTPFSTDWANDLQVVLAPGSVTPSSSTYFALMNGANGVLVGSEVLQFGQVSVNGDGTITLSQLLRGRRGTEWACNSHTSGETVIFLTNTTIYTNKITLSKIGMAQFFKLVPNSGALEDVSPTVTSFSGNDLKPYAPGNVTRAMSGSDIVIAWERRARINGQLIDGTGTVPLGETTEAYEAYIVSSAAAMPLINPANSTTYLHAYTGLTSSTFTYTAAQQAADSFSSASSTLYVVIFQVSTAVGRGFPGYATLLAKP